LTTIGKGLRRERKRLARWLPRGDGWWVLGSGVCAGYKRARRRMAAAYETPSGLTFHAWRRAVKAHRFQVRVLRQVWPAELSARVEQLQRLGELLGQEHDLTVLAQTLADERSCFADDRDCARILALLERRRGELRAQARPLGERLFAERPRDLRRRLGHYLRAFRAEPPGTAASTLRDASADRRPRANGSPAVGAPI
jgi:CHAD domain-containing protein